MGNALITDLYQLTMAYGYWKNGMHLRRAIFHLSFRTAPFGGNDAIACGLNSVIDYLDKWAFDEHDLRYLISLSGDDGTPLFDEEFINALRKMSFDASIWAVPEGTLVHAHQPLLRVEGPLWLCQMLETPLLTLINFHTLVASKAARVCEAAQGAPVLEFGLRRAQGLDGGLAASYAAFVGGCAATSNALAGQKFGIPLKGTHAHSWVMSFETELQAFEAYASALPNNCVFLVDTYNTEQGLNRAIEVGHRLRLQGGKLLGIRLDSGDLAALSAQARRQLDAAGLNETLILASGDLDESSITKLRDKGAAVDVWGVGTKLVTAYDQPALGGVYKMGAIERNGQCHPVIKVSDEPLKTTIPGRLNVVRYLQSGRILGDLIVNELVSEQSRIGINLQNGETFDLSEAEIGLTLLTPVFERGLLVQARWTAHEARANCQESLKTKRLQQSVPVCLEKSLFEMRQRMIDDTSKA